MFLVDTSVWIDYFRPAGAPELKARVRALIEAAAAVTCPVVVAEVLRGARDEAQFRSLQEAFSALVRLPLDERAVGLACRWGFELDRKGRRLPTSDLLIAAAAHEKAVLVHRDRDFLVLAEHAGLKHEPLALLPA